MVSGTGSPPTSLSPWGDTVPGENLSPRPPGYQQFPIQIIFVNESICLFFFLCYFCDHNSHCHTLMAMCGGCNLMHLTVAVVFFGGDPGGRWCIPKRVPPPRSPFTRARSTLCEIKVLKFENDIQDKVGRIHAGSFFSPEFSIDVLAIITTGHRFPNPIIIFGVLLFFVSNFFSLTRNGSKICWNKQTSLEWIRVAIGERFNDVRLIDQIEKH